MWFWKIHVLARSDGPDAVSPQWFWKWLSSSLRWFLWLTVWTLKIIIVEGSADVTCIWSRFSSNKNGYIGLIDLFLFLTEFLLRKLTSEDMIYPIYCHLALFRDLSHMAFWSMALKTEFYCFSINHHYLYKSLLRI